jgi:hypothetical protein
MDSGLFMSNQELAERGMLKFIKEREYCSAWIIKKGIHTLLLQTFNNDLRACFFHKKPKLTR